MRWLIVSLFATVLLATLGFGFVLDYFFKRFQIKQDENPEVLAEQYAPLHLLADEVLRNFKSVEDVEAWKHTHSETSDSVLVSVLARGDLVLPDELYKQMEKGLILKLFSETSSRRLNFYRLFDEGKVVRLSIPVQKMQSRENALIFTFIFYILLMAAVLAWLVPLLKRLNALGDSASKLAQGDLSQRIPKGKISYVRGLEEQFNRMATRIEKLVQDIQVLGSAVSHELRTPLAKLRFGLDALSEENDISRQKAYQQSLSTTIDEMTQLVESLLHYGRMEARLSQRATTVIDVSSLVKEIISMREDAGVHAEIEDGIKIKSDTAFMTLLVNNLLENARKYGDGRVTISLKKQREKAAHGRENSEPEHCVLVVEDNGKGWRQEKIEELLEPFKRGNHLQQGHGLGLALVKRIADWHGADLQLDSSNTLGGARINVIFRLE